jgi:hypothetical protein
MDKNLIDETKSFLELIQTYQQELSVLSFEGKGIDTVNGHLQKSIKESEEASEKILDNINRSLEALEAAKAICDRLADSGALKEAKQLDELLETIRKSALETLTSMEFQDILVQRLIKSSTLLDELKSKLLKLLLLLGINESEDTEEREKMESKLKEIAWEKEVDQDDVDEILKQFGM